MGWHFTPVVAIHLPTSHCGLALAFRHLPEPCLRAVRFFVFRPCSIGGLYILTDTGTADKEVLLYVNVLKNILVDLIENCFIVIVGAAAQRRK